MIAFSFYISVYCLNKRQSRLQAVGLQDDRSSEKYPDGASDERATHGTITQCRWTGVTADQVSTRQKHRVHFTVHTHLARPYLTQSLVFLQLS